MLFFERFHTRLKKWDCSTHHIMSAIRNRYNLFFSTNTWRVPSEDGCPWQGNNRIRKASVASAAFSSKEWDWASIHSVVMSKSRRYGTLDSAEFAQVQDVWAINYVDYDKLRDAYRRAMKKSKVTQKK